MKVIVDDFINFEEERIKFMERHGATLEQINYQKSLVVILDVFKLLCCMVIDKLDYKQINDPAIISLIEETRIREIEKGSDA